MRCQRLSRNSMLFGLMILASSIGLAETPIFGTVRGSSGDALEGVTVAVLARSNGTKMRVSDTKGEYKFEGLGAGSYQVSFEKDGYQTEVREATVTFGDADPDTLDVTLLKNGEKPQPQ